MPFLGQDWRSPGEQWVKTTEGWERLKMWRLKLLDNLNDNIIARLLKLSDYDNMMVFKDRHHGTQPHVMVLKNSTRERKTQVCLGETLNRLDLIGAVKDGRRFNYTSKLIELLIQEHLPQLSGSAQKTIFNILEEMLNQVMKHQNNIHIMQRLLNMTRAELNRSKYNHLGSASLWRKHHETLDKMQRKLDTLQINERGEDGGTTISDLPLELVREILIRLPDGGDIARTGMTEQRTQSLVDDAHLWRDLCLFHFTDRQVVSVVRKGETLMSIGWKGMYTRLMKRYGLKDLFAEMLHLCRHCNALFWKCHGHPCFAHNLPPQSLPMTPAMCVQLFAI